MSKDILKKVIPVVIISLFIYFGLKLILPKPAAYNVKFDKIVKEINAKCPIRIDSVTTLDSVTFRYPENTYINSYSVSNINAEDITVDMINNKLRPYLTNKVKTEESFQVFRKNNITVIFKHYDKNNIIASKIPITPENYNNN